MTTIAFERRPDGCFTGFEASGHAGYAARGMDIVCASISALTQAAAGGLTDIIKIPTSMRVNEEEGILRVTTARGAEEALVSQAQILLKTLEAALKAISDDYPGTIRIIYRERR